MTVEIMEDSVPSTFREAELSSESELWRKAIVDEIESLHVNDIWELVKLPKGNVNCLKITEDKSSKIRVQTPEEKLIIATSAAPRREG